MDDSVVLTAGRPVPAWRWQVKKRGEGLHEGVATVLVVGAKKGHVSDPAHEDLLCLSNKAEVWMTMVRWQLGACCRRAKTQ